MMENYLFMQTLKDKNVLLISATGGIGNRTAKLLAGSGANLFLAGRNADKLQQVATSCNVPADRTFALDISQPAEVTALKEKYRVFMKPLRWGLTTG